jgi:hypothetical protein
MENLIHVVTGIAKDILRGGRLSDHSVEERLTWMERRTTTREEDVAYSMLGIFNVTMPLIYGEKKEKALRRLRKEIDDIEFGKRSTFRSTCCQADNGRCLFRTEGEAAKGENVGARSRD